jgi:nucleotide-binding universal stress UspA family protein
MFKRILIPTDGSERAEHAARAGIEFAKYLDASVVGLYVYAPFRLIVTEPMFITPELISETEYVKAQTHTGKKYLGHIEHWAKEAGVPFQSRIATHDSTAQAIVAAVADAELPCDLVFMGSHGRTALVQAVLGGVTTKVLATCSVPVLVYRDPPAALKSVKAAVN